MPAPKEDRTFEDILAELEKSLESPLVPGEVESWAGSLQQATDELAPNLHRRLHETHPKQYSEIESEDDALIHRVEELKETDGRIETDFHAFQKEVTAFANRAPDLEPEEVEAGEIIERLKEQGLPLVISIREQELAIATWLTEALERDRGVQD